MTIKTVKLPPISEKHFLRYVIDLCDAGRWLYFHDHDSRRNPAGLPDLIMVRDGRIIFAELKTQKSKLRTEQERWLAELQKAEGVETYVWRPSDMPAIEKTLLGHRKRK